MHQHQTAAIVAAFVTRNAVPVSDLPALIATVGQSLGTLGRPESPTERSERKTPAQIRASMSEDYLVSFLDGRHYKTLTRHLSGRGLTPDDYRARFGLPPAYPMVAPSYARRRSELAIASGLGRFRAPAAKLAA